MASEDITPQTQIADSTPKEAVENIQGAKVFNLDPSVYKENKPDLAPTVEKMKLPQAATPAVAAAIQQSPEHAAAIAPDSDKFSAMEGQYQNYAKTAEARKGMSFFDRFMDIAFGEQGRQAIAQGESINQDAKTVERQIKIQYGPQAEMLELAGRKMHGEQLTPEEQMKLYSLREAARDNFGEIDYGTKNPLEKLPVDLITQMVDIPAMIARNKKLFGGIVAAEAAGTGAIRAAQGAAVGATALGAGAIPGAIGGFGQGVLQGTISGSLHAFPIVGMVDSYHQAAKMTYNELDQLPDDPKHPLDETSKVYLAQGVGVVSGLTQFLADRFLVGKIPILQNAKKLATEPAAEGLRSALVSLGKSMGVNASAASIQQVASMVALEAGKDFDGSEVSLTNALMKVTKQIATNEHPKQPGYQGKIFTLQEDVPGSQGAAENLLAAALPAAAGAGGFHLGVDLLSKSFARPTNTDLVKTMPRMEQVAQSLHLQDTIDASSALMKSTELSKLSPPEANDVRRRIIESTGTKFIYMDPEGVREFVGDDLEKAKKVRNIVDPSGVAAGRINAPMQVEMSKAAELADQMPGITEHFHPTPEAPTPKMAKELLAKMEATNAAKAKLLERLNLGEKSPEERAYQLALNPEMSDEDIAKAMGSKEVAQAYLDRLDVNEMAVKEGDTSPPPSKEEIKMLESNLETKKDFLPVQEKIIAASEKELQDHVASGDSLSLQDLQRIKGRNDVLAEVRAKRIQEYEQELTDAQNKLQEFRDSKSTEGNVTSIKKNVKSAREVELEREVEKAQRKIDRQKAKLEEEAAPQTAESLRKEKEAKGKQLQKNLDRHKARLEELKSEISTAEKELEQKKAGVSSPETQQKLEQIQAMRERVTKLKDALPDDMTAKKVMKLALETPQPELDIHNESDYLNQPSFTDALKRNLSEKEVAKIEDSRRSVREEVVKNINDAAKHEMDEVRDIHREMAETVAIQEEMERLNNDPNVAVVDRFHESVNSEIPVEGDQRIGHARKGYSVFAIDPKLLTEEQRKTYLKDEQLKEHKTFVKGGMSPDEAAQFLGVNGGDNLLKILSETPKREKLIEQMLERRRGAIEKEANQHVDLNETALSKAYHEVAKQYLSEMKATAWAATKTAIKRIALPLPRFDELVQQARATVDQMTVGELNANQFKVGERKSNRMAVNAVLDGDLLKAFTNKHAAALNAELANATHQAIGEVNRVIKIAKKFKDAAVMQELKDAGSVYLKAAQELLDVFNLDPSTKGKAERDQFQRFVKQQIEAGVADFSIPERLSDVRTSLKDMTVEQVKVVGDRLESILKQARMKNELWERFGDPAKELQTREAVAQKFVEQLKANPDYDEKRITVKQKTLMTFGEKFARGFNDLAAMLKGAEHIILSLDNGKVGGMINEYIVGPIKGTGKYAGAGEAQKGHDMIDLRDHVKGLIEKFGAKEFENLENDRLFVPEFKDVPSLNNGKVTRGTLLMMLLNRGNEGNSQRLTNFGLSVDTIHSVLERELSQKHVDFAQGIWDKYQTYYPRVADLHEEMTGVRPKMVQAKPFEFNGQTVRGGYFPITYESEMNLAKVIKVTEENLKSLEGETQGKLQDRFYTDDMTEHGHTEDRTGSGRLLNLSMGSIGMGAEAMIHDLNFRKPIASAMKILTHPEVAKAMTSVVGIADFNVLVNTVVDTARSVQMENNALFSSNKIWDKVVANLRSAISVGYLVGNASSIAIQPTSLIYAQERMGAKGAKHMFKVMNAISMNPALISHFYDFAGEIHPAIHEFSAGLDENTRDVVSGMMPKRSNFPVLEPLTKFLDKTNESGFRMLGMVDNFQKVVVANAAYSQFMAGDAEGHSFEHVQSLSPEERDHQAKVYASSVARLTLTAGSQFDRAPIQKNPLLRNGVMFWNDARNALNSTMRMGREIRQDAQAGNYGQMAAGAAFMLTTLAAARLYTDTVRGYNTPLKPSDDRKELDNYWSTYLATVPFDMITADVPYLRDVNYAVQTTEDWNAKSKQVSPTLVKPLNDLYHTVMVGLEAMDIIEGKHKMTTAEKKGLAYTFSYATGGRIPINALFNLYKLAEKVQDGKFSTNNISSDYLKQFDRVKKAQETAQGEDKVDGATMEALEAIRKQLMPGTAAASGKIPANTYAVIKQIESSGNQNAKNPNSSAAGVYQFTKETWSDIMDRAPHLGLTEAGRTSGSERQQEIAMKWFTEQNAKKLSAARLPLSLENLYAAHFLGADKAVEVLTENDKVKMKALISQSAMNANDFPNNMKVRDFKDWLSTKVNTASETASALDKP